MKTEISIEGMNCQHCANNVTEKLSQVAGVTTTTVNLEQKNAIVESSNKLDDAVLRSAIIGAGYTVIGIKEMGN